MPHDYIFTSESVSEGHPDKLCDQISDAIVDAYLGVDPYARLAIETMATANRVIIAGEIRSEATLSNARLEAIVRGCIKRIGYTQEEFHWERVAIEILLNRQSDDIALGVDAGDFKEEGAGDQGIMFGFACDETPTFMPAPLYYAHAILKALAHVRHGDPASILGPDAKSQISLRYHNGKPVGADTIVVSTQHHGDATPEQVEALVRPVIEAVLPKGWMCSGEKLFINPTGRFVIGGPVGDTGLTGRKIIVDTYGGAAPHGGGAFSGKDPTKVDRSAAYMARYMAKNIVAAGLATKCTIQLSYAIGLAAPLSLYLTTHGTGKIDEKYLINRLWDLVPLTPRGIREYLNLNQPIYEKTASYGHFGRTPSEDGSFSWEKTDLVDSLRQGLLASA